MFNLNTCILEHFSVELHSSCGTDLGQSIKKATDNIHSICVDKPVYEIPTIQKTDKSIL